MFTPKHFQDLGGDAAIDSTLRRLKATGTIRLLARGLYDYPLQDPVLGTQSPFDVWLQLPLHSHTPKIEWPPVRIIRTSVDALFTEGVKTHRISGEDLRITTPARTVADCFKHRSKLGIDVCVEALRETLRDRKATIGEISEMGKLLRVYSLMRPYLEAMI